MIDESASPADGGVDPQTDATAQPSIPSDGDRVARRTAELMMNPNILGDVVARVREMGVANEERTVKLLYLALTSRVLSMPVSMVIKGASSSGKSFVLKSVLALFPESAYAVSASVSPKFIVYDDESYVHRVLVFEEWAGLNPDAQYFLRILLSEGYVSHQTLVGPSGLPEPKTLRKQGPTGLVLTTTAEKIHPENETRMISVSVDDTPEQTGQAIIATAEAYERTVTVDLESHRQLQEVIAKLPNKVVIPFIEQLARGIAPVATRLRRDFKKIIGLIQAHALLHRATRSVDPDGRVIATREDYRAVYGIVADLISEGVGASVPEIVRETVEAVSALMLNYPEGVPGNAVAGALGVKPSNSSRRVKTAIAAGYLVNLEASTGKPQRLKLGAPMPVGGQVLPHPDHIGDDCAVAPNIGGATPPEVAP